MAGESHGERFGELIEATVRGFELVELTRHALDRMKVRGISINQILETLRNPRKTGLPTQPGRKRFRGALNKARAVDVVFEEKTDRIVVVTVVEVERQTRN